MAEFRSISELGKLLSLGCIIEKIHPPIFGSDSEVNIVTVTVKCPEGKTHNVRAFHDESRALRDFIRTLPPSP